MVPDGSTARSPSGFIKLASHRFGHLHQPRRIMRSARDHAPGCRQRGRSLACITTRHDWLRRWHKARSWQRRSSRSTYPLYGSLLDLKGVRVDLAGVQAIAVYGKNQKLEVNAEVNTLVFVPDDDSGDLTLKPGDVITLLGPRDLPLASDGTIPDWTKSADVRILRVLDPSGRIGHDRGQSQQLHAGAGRQQRPGVQEFALVSSVSVQVDPISAHANSSRLRADELLRPHRDDSQRQCRPGDAGHDSQLRFSAADRPRRRTRSSR